MVQNDTTWLDKKELVTYTYDTTGNVTKETRGNVTTDYTYNMGNLVTAILMAQKAT